MKKSNPKSFEDSIKRLEEIASLLDNENVGLDQAISLYEEGIELSKSCMTKLKEAELKITMLKKNLDNETIKETEFEE